MNKTLTVGAIVAVIAAVGAVGVLTSVNFISAYAIHNNEGHIDKASVGECKRFTGDADYCQDKESKEVFKEFRKE